MNECLSDKSSSAGIVTIDVEPDNVWADTHSRCLKNIQNLPIFHRLCQDYGVRPTYLVSWSVAADDVCASVLETLLAHGDCEVGIHPHLWETPPVVKQDSSEHAWVGPDYSEEVLEAKLTSLVNLITKRFGAPLSHRAGRWGLDVRHVHILTSLGVRIDTSVIPGIDWSSTGIMDYTRAPMQPYLMGTEDICRRGASELLEVPCTIKPGLRLFGCEKNRYVSAIIRRLGLANNWLRPSPQASAGNLLNVCSWANSRLPQLNLMSHSSEFMAGCSPYWRTESDVDRHFDAYRRVFAWWQNHGVKPQTLSEFRASCIAVRTGNLQ
ncbi:MAG: hypothetical protein V2A66_00075 [Pseudomonadota bacterium]